MSDEFKELNYEGDKYFPVDVRSTSAIFRHGYSVRCGIYTLSLNYNTTVSVLLLVGIYRVGNHGHGTGKIILLYFQD